jgi:hypothetical protein
MSEAVIFNFNNKFYTMHFTNPNAVLPVKLKNGTLRLVKWGRREAENSEMPMGGWARLSSIKSNLKSQWRIYQPRPVKIFAEKFMEKNFEGNPCWYDITTGKSIQGLLAQYENEYRIYIITIEPEDLTNCHYRWPHIITSAIF